MKTVWEADDLRSPVIREALTAPAKRLQNAVVQTVEVYFLLMSWLQFHS